MSFIAELKRRNVFKVTAIYIVVGWLVLQAVDIVFPALNLPDWTITLVVALLVVGFPFALILAWAFELTPQGIRRDTGIDVADPPSPPPAAAPDQNRTATAPRPAPANVTPDRSIAVLPFVNMSGDAENEYFSDGLSETLLHMLTKVGDLRVAARTSSFAFKGRNEDVREIGEKLDVESILEGSVQKAGNRLRITAQLINTRTGDHLWSENYDRTDDDIFAVQDDIADSVVSALQVKLLGAVSGEAGGRGTENAEAYNLFLRGRFLLAQRNLDAAKRALECFESAASLDPGYAAAHCGIGEVIWQLASSFGERSISEAYPRARAAVDRSLELDPDLALAYAVLASFKMDFHWDVEAAERASLRALELDPGNAELQYRHSRFLTVLARWDDAQSYLDRAMVLDPLFMPGWRWGIYMNIYARRFDTAWTHVAKAEEIDAEFPGVPSMKGELHYLAGDFEQALEAAREDTMDWGRRLVMAISLHRLGRAEEAEQSLQELKGTLESAYQVAEIYAQWGETEKAFEWLDLAIAGRDTGITGMLGDPLLDPIRDDLRFTDFIRRVGLPLPSQ